MAKKITSKPVWETFGIGSTEHRKAAAEHHHGMLPWVAFPTPEEAQAAAKRVRISDQRNGVNPPRQVCVTKLADGSDAYGVFFLRSIQPNTDPTA